MEALREANSVYAVVTRTVVVNGQTRVIKRRLRVPQNTTVVEIQQRAMEALDPAIIRMRWIKKPNCRCPHPPHLVIKRLPWSPWFEITWGGTFCMCEINDLLRDIED